MATDPNQEVNEQVAAIVGGLLYELRSQFVAPPPAPVFPPPVPPPSIALPSLPGAPPVALPVSPQTGPGQMSNLGRPSREERRQQQRDWMLLDELYKSAGYQRTYDTPTDEWTPEDLASAGEVQAARLEMESRVGMYRPLSDENAVEAEAVLPTGRRERNEQNPAKAAYYARQAQQRRERRAAQERNRVDAELRNRAGTQEWREEIEQSLARDPGENWQSDLEKAAAMERSAPPSPREMGREAAPPDRNFLQRARQAAVDAGFINRPDVPEAFQTDEWKRANAPLSDTEKLKTFAQASAAVTAVSVLTGIAQNAAGSTASAINQDTPEVGNVMSQMAAHPRQSAGTLVTGVGAGAMGGAAVGGAAGAWVGGAAGGFIALTAVVADTVDKVQRWSKTLIDSRRDISGFSGVIQAMFREMEIEKAARDIKSARATASTSVEAASQYNELLENMRPIKDTTYNTVTWYLGEIMRGWNIIMDSIPGMKGSLEKLDAYNQSQAQLKNNTVKQWAEAWRDTRIPSARVPRR